MTQEEYVDYFAAILKTESPNFPDPEDHATRAIQAGHDAFWGANNWQFKSAEATLTITSSAESYDLPDDFESLRSLRADETSRGLRLQFLSKPEFDRAFPKQTAYSTGKPQVITVFQDLNDNGRWKASFFPRPDGAMTLPYTYYRVPAPASDLGDNIPSKFKSGMEAFILWKLLLGPQRTLAYQEAMSELKRLEVANKAEESYGEYFPVAGDMQTWRGGRDWVA